MDFIATHKMKLNETFFLSDMDFYNGEVCFPVDDSTGMLLVLYSDAGGELTVRGGDGVFAGKDLTVMMEGGYNTLLQIESGPFMQTTGENRGCIVLEGENFAACLIKLA